MAKPCTDSERTCEHELGTDPGSCHTCAMQFNKEFQTYDEWKALVDKEVYYIAGVSSDDLQDFNYRDAFDADESPTAVAVQVLEAAGFDLYKED